MITESFKSKLVRMFANDSLAYSKSFRDFCKRTNLDRAQWDNIEDSDIVEIKKQAAGDFDVILRMIRACRAGKDSYIGLKGKREAMPIGLVYIFGYDEDDRLRAVYNNGNDALYTLSKSGRDYFDRSDRPTSIDEEIKKCFTLYVLALNDKDSRKITQDRYNSVSGMIPSLDKDDRAAKHNVPGVLGKQKGGIDMGRWSSTGAFFSYCGRLVEKNIERYKEIIAQNKFAATDTSAVDDMVKACMERYQEVMKKVIQASSQQGYISIYEINNLINGKVVTSKHSEYGHVQGGLLHLYTQYMSANVDLARQGKRPGGSSLSDSYMKDLKSYEASIKALCATLAAKFKEIEDGIK